MFNEGIATALKWAWPGIVVTGTKISIAPHLSSAVDNIVSILLGHGNTEYRTQGESSSSGRGSRTTSTLVLKPQHRAPGQGLEESPEIRYGGLGTTHSMGTLGFGFTYPNVENVHCEGRATQKHTLAFDRDPGTVGEGTCTGEKDTGLSMTRLDRLRRYLPCFDSLIRWVTDALEQHYKQRLSLVRLTAVLQTAKSGTKFLWHQDTTESAVTHNSVISAILLLDGSRTTVRIATEGGYADFELGQKLEMLHFHSSLFHRSVYTMDSTDRCLKLVLFFELKTGRTRENDRGA